MNQILTFGCRLNTYESEVMRQAADQAGLTNAVIVNSCAVTKEAERQVRQSIRKARKEAPDATIVVTGCAAQINPKRYAQMPEVDHVLGNQEKLSASSYKLEEAVKVNDIMSVEETAGHLVNGLEGKSRAFIQVQNGCNHRCTFCIIPYGRGNSRSVPMGEVVEQVRHLVENGYKEVVLTGVDISDYGKDLPNTPTLGQLMKRLLKAVPELPRLRLSSIDVAEIDSDILDLLENEPRFMPHLHISLQAGDDMVLKRMKRRHSRADVIAFCTHARQLRPGIALGADIIAGFPTETDAMFNNTRTLIEEVGLHYLHVFPYSEREGTPAAKMPSVPKLLRKERADILRQTGKKQLEQFLASKVGTQASVLIEHNGSARTEHFLPVICADSMAPNSLLNQKVLSVQGESLVI